MSASARFLLEFQATGDQEVVNKIREVGQAGQDAASQLESLQGIEDPFAAVGQGAEDAITPVTELGSAAGETAPLLAEMGTEGEAATTGMKSMGSSITTMSSSMAAIGGTIGTVVSSLFRYNEIQLKVQKAQLASARATESSRKAEEGLDRILATATGNTEALATARENLTTAQGEVNRLMSEGVTSGADYEAATSALQAAQVGLANEASKAGVNVSKLTGAMEKSELAAGKNVIATQNMEKVNNQANQGLLDLAFGFTSMGGTIVQSVGSAGKFAGAVKALGSSAAGTIIPLAGMAGGIGGITKSIIGVLGPALAAAYAGFIAFEAIPPVFKSIIASLRGDLKTAGEEALNLFKILQTATSIDLGPLGKVMLPYTELFHALVPELEKYVKTTMGAKGPTDNLAASTTDLVGRFNHAKDGFMQMFGVTEKNSTAQTDLQSRFVGTGEATADLTAKTMEYGKAADNNLVVTKQIASTIAALPGAIGNTVSDVELFTAAWQKQTGVVNNYRNVLETNEGVMIRSGGSYVQLAGNVEDLGTGVSRVNGVLVNNADILNKSGLSAKRNADSTKVMQAAWQDVSSTIEESESALLTETNAIEKDIDAKYEMAHVNDLLTGSQLDFENALADVAVALSESNRELATAQKVRADAGAQADILHTALNNEVISLINEEAALKASIAATTDATIQDLKLSNAKLEGTKAAMEFISSLDEEKASQEANIAVLRQSVSAMGVFGDATLQTADQLEQFAAVAAGVPSAIRELAGEIGGLAQEATKFLEFAGEEDELFGNWEISDKIPNEIRDMMSDSDIAFIHGRAQLERTMESLGPLTGVKFAKAISTAKQGGLAELRNFGPEAAALLREGFPTMDAALAELTDSFADLGTTADKNMVNAMARVVTAMKNVEDPTASLAQQMIALSNSTGQSIAPLLGVAGGLEQLSAAGEDVTVKLSEIPLVKITDDAGNAVAEFANFNGQLVPIGGAAQGAATGLGAMTGKINPLNAAIQLAGKSLEQFGNFVGNFFSSTLPSIVSSHALNVNPFTGMISVSIASLNQFASAVAQKMAEIKQSFSKGLGGVKQSGGGIPIQVNIAPALKQLQSLKVQIGLVKQTKVTLISVNTSAATTAVNRLKSLVNALPNIKRTITYTYRITGTRPNPPNLSRTITYRYRTVGTRPAQTGMHENLASDTLIAAHKGERVDISPHTINTNENRTAIIPASGTNARPINIMVRGDVNGKELIRFVKFNLMEGTGGVM